MTSILSVADGIFCATRLTLFSNDNLVLSESRFIFRLNFSGSTFLLFLLTFFSVHFIHLPKSSHSQILIELLRQPVAFTLNWRVFCHRCIESIATIWIGIDTNYLVLGCGSIFQPLRRNNIFSFMITCCYFYFICTQQPLSTKYLIVVLSGNSCQYCYSIYFFTIIIFLLLQTS